MKQTLEQAEDHWSSIYEEIKGRGARSSGDYTVAPGVSRGQVKTDLLKRQRKCLSNCALYEVIPETLIFYHRSNNDFVFPEENILTENTNWHSNGAMGLWCSTFPNMCECFGEYCYEVKVCSDARWVGWAYNDFYDTCQGISSRLDYLTLRENFLRNGIDVIFIVDASENINEVIILNYRIITFNKVRNIPKDVKYTLTLRRKINGI